MPVAEAEVKPKLGIFDKLAVDLTVYQQEFGFTSYSKVKNFTENLPARSLVTFGYEVNADNLEAFYTKLKAKMPVCNKRRSSHIVAEGATLSGGGIVIVRATGAQHRKLAFGNLAKNIHFLIQPDELRAVRIRQEAVDISLMQHLVP